MSVLFVIDLFGIDNQEAVIAERSPVAIEQLKQRINQHLKNNDFSVLRIRFNNEALFNRFSYFQGLDGVLPVKHLIPRAIYRDLVNEALPDWLTDELIMQLGLLKGQSEIAVDSDNLIDKIFRSCNADIFTEDFLLYTDVLQEQSKAFWQLLSIPDVQLRLIENLQRIFKFNETLATLFIHHLLKAKSAVDFFTLLAYQQHQELLRKSFTVLQLSLPLPARSLPMELLSLPIISLEEKSAKELLNKNLKALEDLCRKIEKEQREATEIAHLIIAPWPRVLDKLTFLVNRNSRFISNELKIKLEGFNDRESKKLVKKITEQIELSRFGPLSDTTPTNEVVTWSKGYFEFIHQQFSTKQQVDEVLNLSFSNWLLKQSARVARSDNDWRVFSKRVNDFLAQDYLVVICMVDALSALHQDLILESAKAIDHLSVASETLFAPLPTLTEIGKMALITGTATCNLPSDQESAIRETYGAYLPEKDSLKLFKSWKSAANSDHIDEKTNLVVFLENRIDERLHECVDYEKHRADVSVILNQMMGAIDNWKKDAAYMNRDVVFLITADHGMTVTQANYQGEKLGEGKERVFKVASDYADDHDDFGLVHPGGSYAYLIAKNRMRLADNALLSHGGITPEEVLIPFVTLSSRQSEVIKTPLELVIFSKNAQRLKEKSWQITVELNAKVAVNNISIKFIDPLMGEESVVAIPENGSQRLVLNFSSHNEQSGLIEFSLELSYDREGAHEVNLKDYSCVLPEPLIDKDEKTQGFEDMFS